MSAIRLTFDVIEGQPRLRSARRLRMQVPPQQRIGHIGSGAGLWLELRDQHGTALYQRVLDAETFHPNTEIRSGAADRPLLRQSTQNATSLFHAVIPDHPQGHSLHIFERLCGDAKRATQELVNLDLRRLPDGSGATEVAK